MCCDMAYDETGGCRACPGFFRGECPIHEIGRQSLYTKNRKNIRKIRLSMLICARIEVCPGLCL